MYVNFVVINYNPGLIHIFRFIFYPNQPQELVGKGNEEVYQSDGKDMYSKNIYFSNNGGRGDGKPILPRPSP